MKVSKNAILLLGLVLTISLSAFPEPIDASQPTGYDLVAAVNAYRAANGYYALSSNSLVMTAAQTHAEWIVSTGQGGHIGASGSNETDRVSWTGYGGGVNILCDENWASGTNINDVIFGTWSDWVHQEVMLNAWGNLYTDIGGGVAAQGNGRYVFVLDVCKVYGQEYSGEVPESSGSPPNGTANSPATPDLSNFIFDVTVATPLVDGTIKHTVLYGQTLISIANAYGIKVEVLRELNNMEVDATIIYPDQELLIQPGNNPAQSQVSETLTVESKPKSIPTAAIETQTPQPSLAVTEILPASATPTLQLATDKTPIIFPIGLVMVAIFGVSLVVFLYFSYLKK